MQYRTCGKLDWESSVLGFGILRLPVIDGDPGKINEPEATRMVRYAIDHGVNYVDTAYTYHDGHSEAFLGRALQDGYRERVRLATKLPCWLVERSEDFDRYLNEQLERLQTDHVDFYLLHSLKENTWRKMRDLNVFRWAERAIADGRIHHLGFSFHDRYELFEEIVDAYDGWTLCLILYNYMDEEFQAGTRGLKYAADKGLAVAVMEPIRGGGLAQNVPPSIQALWNTASHKRTQADWALQWVWNHSEVSVALSGMSTMEQVKQNIASANQSSPGTLTEEELALITQVRDKYRELFPIRCSKCEYCLPCPNGVNIPHIFELYNQAIAFNEYQATRWRYGWLRDKEEPRADSCIQCGQCLELCPQQIEIHEWLAKAHELLKEPEAS